MSDMARKARLALKAKAKSLANEKDQKVDSSDWTQAEPLNADVKTGARPVSRRAFKKGGKVEGEKAKMNVGRKPRKSGGAAPKDYANAKINRNVKDANEEREGKKHVGGFKKGGRASKQDGGEAYDREGLKKLIERESTGPSRSGNPEQLMPKGKGVKTREVEAFDLYDPKQLERLERGYKKGGRTKKKIGGALEFLSPVAMLANAVRDDKDEKKRGGRAKKQMGGPLMDPRLAMVDKGALPGFNQLTPGMKKGGKAKAGASFKEMREKFGTQVMQKGGKAHGDEAMDKALIKKMVKKEARTGRASGGRQSFNSAFAEARKNGMDLFEWNGKKYTTQLAEQAPAKKPAPQAPAADRAAQTYKDLAGDESLKKPSSTYGELMGDDMPKTTTQQEPKKEISRFHRETPLQGWGSRYKGWSEKKAGGRAKRASGGMIEGDEGHAKKKKGSGKTNINIIIAAGKPADQQDMMPPMMPPPETAPQPPMKGPQTPPPPAGMVGIPMGMPMGGAPAMPPPPPQQQPPMQRKAGGRVAKVAKSYQDMEAGAGSGEGRLQKTDIAKRNPKPAFSKGENVYEGRGYPNKVLGATGGRTARKEGGSVKKIVGGGAGKSGSSPRKKYMFGGAPAEAVMVKKGIDPAMARNPKYQIAYGMAGGDQGQADFNYRLLSFLGGGGSDLSKSQANNPNASMNPTAGLKAILPGARAKGGKVYKSYKDMDAGAGSGEGRLEKAEIQKRKR